MLPGASRSPAGPPHRASQEISRPREVLHRDIVLHDCGHIVVRMRQSRLLLQCIVASVIVAITVWATLGAPPRQTTNTSFIVAWRR